MEGLLNYTKREKDKREREISREEEKERGGQCIVKEDEKRRKIDIV